MLLAVVLVVIAIRANVSCLTALWVLLGGLALQGGSNLIGLAVAKPALQRKPWAVFVIRRLWPVVPVAISLYIAAVFTLIIQGCRAGCSRFTG
jgi:hypothetical protein